MPKKPTTSLQDALSEFLRRHEGNKDIPYSDVEPSEEGLDITKGKPTIGVGHQILPNEKASGVIKTREGDVSLASPLSKEDVDKVLRQDISNAENLLKSKIDPNMLSPDQKVAAISRTFNLGGKAYGDSTKIGELLKAAKQDPLNASSYISRTPAYMDEIKGSNVPLPGLVSRRIEEQELTNKPLSSLADLKKLDETTVQKARELDPTLTYSPPAKPELLEQADKIIKQGLPEKLQASLGNREPSSASQSETENLIKEYKDYLNKINDQMLVDQDALNTARNLDAINSIAKTFGALAPNQVNLPDSPNYTNQYYQELQQKRAGLKEGLDARSKLLDLARSMQLQKSREDLARERIQAGKEQRLQKERKLSDKQLKDVSDFDRTIGETESLLQKLANNTNWTGPLDAMVPNALVGEDQVRFRNAISRMSDAYRQLITGAGASDKELQRLETRLPQASDSFTEFQAKAKELIATTQRSRGTLLDTLSKGGKDISNFIPEDRKLEDKNQPFPMKVRKPLPNGKTQVATVSNEDELKAAREKGFN